MLSTRLNLIALVLIAVFFSLQYRLWFQSDGIRDMMKIKKSLSEQIAANDVLKKRNEELLFQIQHLRNSHDATESRARNELGMVKKGEMFYQIVK